MSDVHGVGDGVSQEHGKVNHLTAYHNPLYGANDEESKADYGNRSKTSQKSHRGCGGIEELC